MNTLSRREVQQKIDSVEDLTVIVDVLPEKSYNEYHLPGALNVPLGEGFGERIEKAVPDKDRPVILYCHDTECNASPKAAREMEQLGYNEVYDYEAGKVDWREAGLPIEGRTAGKTPV